MIEALTPLRDLTPSMAKAELDRVVMLLRGKKPNPSLRNLRQLAGRHARAYRMGLLSKELIENRVWEAAEKLNLLDHFGASAIKEQIDGAFAEADETSADDPSVHTIEPVDLWGNFDPPSLPAGLLPNRIAQFAHEQSELMGADPAGLAMAALVVCAAAIPDSIQLRVKRHDASWLESARLWSALIGLPSTKKSPIARVSTAPLVRLDAQLFRDWQKARAEYDALPAEERKLSAPPKQVRLRLEDTTIEAAQEILKDSHEGVLLFQDELAGWFGAMDKYGGRGASKDRAFYLTAFNGGHYVVNRVNRGATLIENLSMSLLGGIQPDLIRKIAGESSDDGLLQRLIPIVLRPSKTGRDEPGGVSVGLYSDLIEDLNRMTSPTRGGVGNLAGTSCNLVFDDAAQQLRGDLEVRHLQLQDCESINRKLASHIGKYDGIFARLCVVWHCIDGAGYALDPVISIDTANRAADFLHRFLLPHAVAFYAGMLGLSDDHERLTAVAGYILARKLDRITNRDIQRGDRTMRSLNRRDMDAVFDQLDALGWVSRIPGPRPTDPPHWSVNPEVHRKFGDRAKREAERRERSRNMISGLLQSEQGDDDDE